MSTDRFSDATFYAHPFISKPSSSHTLTDDEFDPTLFTLRRDSITGPDANETKKSTRDIELPGLTTHIELPAPAHTAKPHPQFTYRYTRESTAPTRDGIGITMNGIELPILRTHVPTPAQSEVGNPKEFTRLYPDSIDVRIRWGRERWNTKAQIVVTHADERIGMGDRIFDRDTYGNGTILEVVRYHGKYVHFLVTFENTRGGVWTRTLAVPTFRSKLTHRNRMNLLLALIGRPWVHYYTADS
jgi:hypothetical protein